jgi:hypothetical protein
MALYTTRNIDLASLSRQLGDAHRANKTTTTTSKQQENGGGLGGEEAEE